MSNDSTTPRGPYPDGYYENVGRDLSDGFSPEVMADLGYNDPLVNRARGVGEAALPDRSDVVEPVDEGVEQPPSPEQQFAECFKWVPNSRGEVTLALRGLESEINTANLLRGLSGVEKEITKAEGFERQARFGASILLDVVDGDPEDAPAKVDPDELRRRTDALTVMASHRLSSKALETQKWPRHQQGAARDKLLQPIVDQLVEADAGELTSLYGSALGSALQRYRLWNSELKAVENHPRVRELRSEARDPSRRR